MRCRECNVDVSENYKKCPLCGSAVYDDEPIVKGLKAAPYPENVLPQKTENPKKPKTAFTIEKLKAYFNL